MNQIGKMILTKFMSTLVFILRIAIFAFSCYFSFFHELSILSICYCMTTLIILCGVTKDLDSDTHNSYKKLYSNDDACLEDPRDNKIAKISFSRNLL